MEQTSEFFDFSGPPNLFNLVEKDDDDQFPLKVIKKEKISPDQTLTFSSLSSPTPSGSLVFGKQDITSGTQPSTASKFQESTLLFLQ